MKRRIKSKLPEPEKIDNAIKFTPPSGRIIFKQKSGVIVSKWVL